MKETFTFFSLLFDKLELFQNERYLLSHLSVEMNNHKFQNKSFLISSPVYPALFSVEIRHAKHQNTIYNLSELQKCDCLIFPRD